MRIGIDCRLWNETGVGRYTRNLVRELAQIDKQNEYVLFVSPKDLLGITDYEVRIKKCVEEKRWKVVPTEIRWHTVQEQMFFPNILNKENLDLVHFPYFSVPIFYSKPFIVTIHDLIIHHFSTGQASTLPYPLYLLKRYAYKYVISQAAHKACAVVAVSSATKEEIVDHLHVEPEKIAVIYESVDPSIFAENDERASVPEEYMLYVGNAYPHKNLEKLLSAFANLRSGQKRMSLVLLGRDDFFYRKLKDKYGGIDGIIFKTVSSDHELGFFYRHAKALVMPSLMEGFGLPPLEAMSNDCLVLASDIPSLREVCQDAALYFNPASVSDMTEKMKEVLSLKAVDVSKLRSAGKKRVAAFSWKKMAEETLHLYEDCLDE